MTVKSVNKLFSGYQIEFTHLGKSRFFLIMCIFLFMIGTTGGNMKCPKKHVKENLSHVFYSKFPTFLMFEIFEMPHFAYLIHEMGKWGVSNISNIKSGAFGIKST